MEKERLNPDWRKYEQVVAIVMESLYGIPDILVKHDETIMDLDGCECQIDVLIEDRTKSKNDPEITIIECKYRNERVSRSVLGGFIHMCETVGAKKGIFVSKKGFGSGAIIKSQNYEWLELIKLSEFSKESLANTIGLENITLIKMSIGDEIHVNVNVTSSSETPPSQSKIRELLNEKIKVDGNQVKINLIDLATQQITSSLIQGYNQIIINLFMKEKLDFLDRKILVNGELVFGNDLFFEYENGTSKLNSIVVGIPICFYEYIPLKSNHQEFKSQKDSTTHAEVISLDVDFGMFNIVVDSSTGRHYSYLVPEYKNGKIIKGFSKILNPETGEIIDES